MRVTPGDNGAVMSVDESVDPTHVATTVRSDDDTAICTLERSLNIVIISARTAPYASYQLPSGTKLKLTVSISYPDGHVVDRYLSYTVSSESKVFRVAIRPEGGMVTIWADPYAVAALYCDGASSARGRITTWFGEVTSDDENEWIKVGFPDLLSESDDNEDAWILVELLQSVVFFIASEMNRNRVSEQVRTMRALNREAYQRFSNAGQDGSVSGIFKDQASAMGNKIRTMLSLSISGFPGHGEWDYKIPVGMVWKERNRLGNEEYYYYYDLWSNIHYGYIGACAGFHLFDLLFLSQGAHILAQKTLESESSEDVDATSEGYQLFGANLDQITVDVIIAILARHPEWRRSND
jgi:hypothetical protein